MNLGYATFFIRIMIVCGESSASKLRSKQYPVKISSGKKSDRFDQKHPEQLLMHWITGLASNTYLSWTMKRAFQNYGNRRRSEERGVVTNLQWQTYQYVRGGRRGGAKTDGSAETTHSVVHGCPGDASSCLTTRVDTCRVKKCRGSTRDLRNPGQPTTYMSCVAYNLITVSNSSSRT